MHAGITEATSLTWSPLEALDSQRLNQPVIKGETRTLTAVVYSSRTFKIPPGFVTPDGIYAATITARQAPWDLFDHAPFLAGTPFHSADCLTAVFTP